MTDFIVGLALVFVIEGCLWSLFPESMKQAAIRMSAFETRSLRTGGLVFAFLGVAIVWLIRD